MRYACTAEGMLAQGETEVRETKLAYKNLGQRS